jgi:hypothetical protein
VQGTADRLTESSDSLVFDGNVELAFEKTSATASRAVATPAADGNMTLTLENAVMTREAENTAAESER